MAIWRYVEFHHVSPYNNVSIIISAHIVHYTFTISSLSVIRFYDTVIEMNKKQEKETLEEVQPATIQVTYTYVFSSLIS